MVQQKKKDLLQKIVDFINENSNFSLIKFEKTKHSTLEDLRKTLKKNNASFKVIKNSLLQKALNNLATTNKIFNEFKKNCLPLKDNTAILGLGKNWSEAMKAFFDYSQKEKSLSFKVGILDNEVYTNEKLLVIAKLPSKNQLLGKLISSFKSPMNNVVYSMKFNMNKLVYILTQKSKN